MKIQETKAFLKEKGVIDTLVTIFQHIKDASEKSEQYAFINFSDSESANNFNEVLLLCGHKSEVLTKEDKIIIVVYLKKE